MSEKTRERIIEQAAQSGDGRVPLRLALNLMRQPQRSAEDEALMRAFLAQAAEEGDFGMKVTVQNLIALLDAPGKVVSQ